MAGGRYGELARRGATRYQTRQVSAASTRKLRVEFTLCHVRQVVRVDGQRQFVERLEDTIWCEHIPIKGIVERAILRHLRRRQIHRDRLRRQEGDGLRGYLLNELVCARATLPPAGERKTQRFIEIGTILLFLSTPKQFNYVVTTAANLPVGARDPRVAPALFFKRNAPQYYN